MSRAGVKEMHPVPRAGLDNKKELLICCLRPESNFPMKNMIKGQKVPTEVPTKRPTAEHIKG